VILAEAFERALGRQRAFEIIKKAAEQSGVQRVRNQLSKKPIKKFEDFKLSMKEEDKSPFWTHNWKSHYSKLINNEGFCL